MPTLTSLEEDMNNYVDNSIHKDPFYRSKWYVSVIRVACFIFLLGLIRTPVWSCDGTDYKETLQLLQEALVAGYNMGKTDDYNKYLPILQEISNRGLALPLSCQQLLEQWSKEFGNSYNPNKTHCVGGICCDGSVCY